MITGRRRRFVTGRFESDSFFVDEASEDKIHAESDSGREARLIKEVALHRGLSLPAAGARSGFADFLISLFFFQFVGIEILRLSNKNQVSSNFVSYKKTYSPSFFFFSRALLSSTKGSRYGSLLIRLVSSLVSILLQN